MFIWVSFEPEMFYLDALEESWIDSGYYINCFENELIVVIWDHNRHIPCLYVATLIIRPCNLQINFPAERIAKSNWEWFSNFNLNFRMVWMLSEYKHGSSSFSSLHRYVLNWKMVFLTSFRHLVQQKEENIKLKMRSSILLFYWISCKYMVVNWPIDYFTLNKMAN